MSLFVLFIFPILVSMNVLRKGIIFDYNGTEPLTNVLVEVHVNTKELDNIMPYGDCSEFHFFVVSTDDILPSFQESPCRVEDTIFVLTLPTLSGTIDYDNEEFEYAFVHDAQLEVSISTFDGVFYTMHSTDACPPNKVPTENKRGRYLMYDPREDNTVTEINEHTHSSSSGTHTFEGSNGFNSSECLITGGDEECCGSFYGNGLQNVFDASSNNHEHEITGGVTSEDIPTTPSYFDVLLCESNFLSSEHLQLALFDYDPRTHPSGHFVDPTFFETDLRGKLIRVSNSSSTGGSDNHTHIFRGMTSMMSTVCNEVPVNEGNGTGSTCQHTHSYEIETDGVFFKPPYITFALGRYVAGSDWSGYKDVIYLASELPEVGFESVVYHESFNGKYIHVGRADFDVENRLGGAELGDHAHTINKQFLSGESSSRMDDYKNVDLQTGNPNFSCQKGHKHKTPTLITTSSLANNPAFFSPHFIKRKKPFSSGRLDHTFMCNINCYHGICQVSDEITCNCDDNWGGLSCEAPTANACNPKCSSHGTCAADQNVQPYCNCQTDYSGASCDLVEEVPEVVEQPWMFYVFGGVGGVILAMVCCIILLVVGFLVMMYTTRVSEEEMKLLNGLELDSEMNETPDMSMKGNKDANTSIRSLRGKTPIERKVKSLLPNDFDRGIGGIEAPLREEDIEFLEDEGEGDDLAPNLKVNPNLLVVPYRDLKLVARIGSGGSESTIFKADWKGKFVACKIFKTSTLTSEKDFEEFETEIAIMTSISHPNVIRFFGATIQSRRVGLIMQYCAHGTIMNYIIRRRGNVDIILKFEFLEGIACALDYLHQREIIHRDIKSQNILLTERLKPKIIDFGLSKIMERAQRQQGMTTCLGTRYYMAPEVFSGIGKYGCACDVYSFAIVMYEILSELQDPYEEIANLQNVTNIELKVFEDENFRPLIKDDDEHFPDWIKECIVSSWQSDPSLRPTAYEISQLIKEELAKLRGDKRQSTMVESQIEKQEDLVDIETLKRDVEKKEKEKKNPPKIPKSSSRPGSKKIPPLVPKNVERPNMDMMSEKDDVDVNEIVVKTSLFEKKKIIQM